MELFDNLALGFSTASSLNNILFCLIGVLLGTLIGVLPGIGPGWFSVSRISWSRGLACRSPPGSTSSNSLGAAASARRKP